MFKSEFCLDCSRWLSGKDERQEPVGAATSGRHERLRFAFGREDQGDLEDLAADHRSKMGRVSQRLHPGLRGLPGPVLLRSGGFLSMITLCFRQL